MKACWNKIQQCVRAVDFHFVSQEIFDNIAGGALLYL